MGCAQSAPAVVEGAGSVRGKPSISAADGAPQQRSVLPKPRPQTAAPARQPTPPPIENVVERTPSYASEESADTTSSGDEGSQHLEAGQPDSDRLQHSRAASEPFCLAAGLRHAGRRKVKSENQDFLCNEAHMSGTRQERSLFGIFDGHGACGKPIAQHCSWLLPNFADVAVQEAQQAASGDSVWDMEDALTASFMATEEEVRNLKLDTTASGSTATLLVIQGAELWVAWVGDSRAVVMTKRSQDSTWAPFQGTSAPPAPSTPPQAAFGSKKTMLNGGTHLDLEPLIQHQARSRGPPNPALSSSQGAEARVSDWDARLRGFSDGSVMDLMSTTDLDFDAGRDLDPETRSALSSYHSTYSNIQSRERLREHLHSRGDRGDRGERGERKDELLTPTFPGISSSQQPSNGDQRTLDRLQGVLDPRLDKTHSASNHKGPSQAMVAELRQRVGNRTGLPAALRAVPLTRDHRPGDPLEKARLVEAGARVHPKRLRNGRAIGEPRLWLQQLDIPGLLLSRAIGNDIASLAGATARPQVRHARLQEGDTHIVIGSDGVWDVLCNDEVAELVSQNPHPEAACKAIVARCMAAWRALEASDNITVLVVRLVWAGEEVAPPVSQRSEPISPFAALPLIQTGKASSRPAPIRTTARAEREVPDVVPLTPPAPAEEESLPLPAPSRTSSSHRSEQQQPPTPTRTTSIGEAGIGSGLRPKVYVAPEGAPAQQSNAPMSYWRRKAMEAAEGEDDEDGMGGSRTPRGSLTPRALSPARSHTPQRSFPGQRSLSPAPQRPLSPGRAHLPSRALSPGRALSPARPTTSRPTTPLRSTTPRRSTTPLPSMELSRSVTPTRGLTPSRSGHRQVSAQEQRALRASAGATVRPTTPARGRRNYGQ